MWKQISIGILKRSYIRKQHKHYIITRSNHPNWILTMFNSAHPSILMVEAARLLRVLGGREFVVAFAVLRFGPDNNQKAASGCMTSSALSRSPRSLLSGLQAISSVFLQCFTGPTAPPDRDGMYTHTYTLPRIVFFRCSVLICVYRDGFNILLRHPYHCFHPSLQSFK